MGLLTTILALRGRVTGGNLSRSCDYSERTIARQFRVLFAWPDFHERVRTTALEPRSELISVPEASFIPTSGKPTFGLGYFFTGCANRAEPGLESSPVAVVDGTRRCAFTLAVAQTPPGKADREKGKRAEETRMDCSPHQLHEQRHRLPATIRYHCVDGDLATQKYRDAVVAVQLHPLTKLRHDATGWLLSTGPHPKRRGRRRQDDGKVPVQDLSRFDPLGTMADNPPIYLYTALVWHVSRKRQWRLVVLVNRKEVATPRSIVLASTDLPLDGHKVVELYAARFQIECLFRDSKQFTGLADCPSRAQPVLDFPFTAAPAPLNLARVEDLRAQTAPTPHVFSMASWKQRHFNNRVLAVCIENLALDPMWVKNHPGYENLTADGAIAA